MHLEGLAGCGPKSAIPKAVSQLIDGQKKAGRYASAWIAETQHHLPVLFLALSSILTVVLLIGTVKLENLNGPFSEMGVIILQLRGQGLPQVVAGELVPI